VNLTDAHNAVWNAWLHGHRAPLRACVRGVLPQPEMLVEIMVTAVR
jgi:enamine deaminase RidA (YjgF/YER057c/UK114 family)